MNILQQMNAALESIVAQGRRSLVHVRDGDRSGGAGVVWRSDGLIVTNAHVVRRNTSHITLANGRTLCARVLAADTQHDLAALAVEAQALPVIKPGEREPPCPGTWVLALGHPWGVPGAATTGVIIATGVPPEFAPGQQEMLQVSLHLRPGHSGGPLLDVQGRLIGINTMMAGPDVGLAIPLRTIQAFLHPLTRL